MCFELDSLPPIPVIRGAAVSHEDLELRAADGTAFAAFAARPDDPSGVGPGLSVPDWTPARVERGRAPSRRAPPLTLLAPRFLDRQALLHAAGPPARLLLSHDRRSLAHARSGRGRLPRGGELAQQQRRQDHRQREVDPAQHALARA